jgi:4-amino-4-deoxy-L-arabinose transferase-like glycosyltransferase
MAEKQRRRVLWRRRVVVGVLGRVLVFVMWYGWEDRVEAEYVTRLRRKRLGLD